MLFAQVPKEINDYDSKIWIGLTRKQLGWGALALILGFTTFFSLKVFIPTEIVSWVVMAVTLVPFLCGFVKIQGLPADIFIKISWTFYSSRKLIYDNCGGLLNVKTISKEEKKKQKIAKRNRAKLRKLTESGDEEFKV